MTIVPIRNIGKFGVNTDFDPLELPTNVFTMANNVRFVGSHIRRGPVFSTVGDLTTKTQPRHVLSYKLLSGTAKLYITNTDGTIVDWSATAPGSLPNETIVSPSGWTPNVSDLNITTTILNDVVYINRPDHVPWYKTTGSSTFQELPVWDPSWRCETLRSFNGQLVALNVTKGAVKYPTMVKTSDYAAYSSYPTSWTGNTTNSATENVLEDLQDPLVDALPLRDRLILYANTETWIMEPRSDALVYNYKRLFTSRGVINQNCVVEYNNTHFVFGFDDIWMHDGYSNKSIAIGRVRDYVFNNMVRAQIPQFFAINNPKQGEVLFCFVSDDPYAYFPVGGSIGYPGCNRAAVYNYIYDTWSFYDLPYLTGAGLGVAYASLTFGDLQNFTYNGIGGSFNSYFDASRLYLLTAGKAASFKQQQLAARVRIFETPNIAVGAGLTDTIATAPVFIENKQMDMDEISTEIRGYKVVNQMYPEAHLDAGAPPLYFTWGSADYSNVMPIYDHTMSFDGVTNYKLDFNAPGRFLSLKIDYAGTQDFTLSGFDIDYAVFGHR